MIGGQEVSLASLLVAEEQLINLPQLGQERSPMDMSRRLQLQVDLEQ